MSSGHRCEVIASQSLAELIAAAKGGDRFASSQLLPIVYAELRKLAVARMANEAPQHTLQPTALVHEAYLRLLGPASEIQWDNAGHFFAAAAEAMRRILVDAARHKATLRQGGDRRRVELNDESAASFEVNEDLVALDEALNRLAEHDPIKAELVNLRYFAGLTLSEAAKALGISERTAGRHWTFARAWLRRDVEGGGGKNT